MAARLYGFQIPQVSIMGVPVQLQAKSIYRPNPDEDENFEREQYYILHLEACDFLCWQEPQWLSQILGTPLGVFDDPTGELLTVIDEISDAVRVARRATVEAK